MFELPKIKPEEICSNIIHFLISAIPKGKKCVLGLSGGIDSAVVAYLLTTAFGKDKIIPLILSYGKSKYTIQAEEDARLISQILKLSTLEFDISEDVDRFFHPEYDFSDQTTSLFKLRKGNVAARIRMIIQYDISMKKNGIVVGTTNKSELLTGYFTKYGDGGVDIEPISGLYKTYIYEIAKYLGIPDKIINKPPSANLWEGQTDEDELGITYEVLDKILYNIEHPLFSLDGPIVNETYKKLIKEFSKKLVDKIEKIIENTEHKRNIPLNLTFKKF